MTKNGAIILVTDEFGNGKGFTYPKRARGLVKKGRAQQVNDNEIRLLSPTYITEDDKMENITNQEPVNTATTTIESAPEIHPLSICFSARDFFFNPDCKQSNKGERSYITGFEGNLTEVYTIGDWSYSWSEIRTKSLTLPKETECRFSFWLNGGENDNNTEICQLNVIFDGDYEDRLIYKLNRSFIKPLKRLNGWELYEIPFFTGQANNTVICFVAQRAPMTVMPAKDKSEYLNMEDCPDEFADERPQRHNIVFEDGWPKNTWYSTKKLVAVKNGTDDGCTDKKTYETADEFRESFRVLSDIDTDEIADEVRESILSGISLEKISENIYKSVMDSLGANKNVADAENIGENDSISN